MRKTRELPNGGGWGLAFWFQIAGARPFGLCRGGGGFTLAAAGSRLLADLVEGSEIAPEFQDLVERRPEAR